jgi:peptidoglycan/xylan/chitin deacetylase (PgdA/CDA1 family)
LSIRSRFGDTRRFVWSSIHRRSVRFTNREPIVSFTFDDFPRTAYSTGGAILEGFGARGTYYAAAGLMNTSNELGEQFCPDDLHALLAKGHELGSHTFGHVSCRDVSCSEFRADVEKGRRVLKQLTGLDSENFSYPFGDVTLKTKRIVGPDLASARSIFPGFNGNTIDLNLLRANRLYGDVDRCAGAGALIEENVRRRAWLIFYTHDVRPQPSEYGCTPELFEWVVSSAVRSGSRILPVAQVLAEVGFARGMTPSAGQEVAQVRS